MYVDVVVVYDVDVNVVYVDVVVVDDVVCMLI
jgi:hypothetical protein